MGVTANGAQTQCKCALSRQIDFENGVRVYHFQKVVLCVRCPWLGQNLIVEVSVVEVQLQDGERGGEGSGE